MTEKRFTICVDSNNLKSLWDNQGDGEPLLWLTLSDRIGGIDDVCELLNELHEENQELSKYKYLTKALEEVSGSHIEELIADFSDGAYCEDKDQIELGKWVVEHGLSWEDLE